MISKSNLFWTIPLIIAGCDRPPKEAVPDKQAVEAAYARSMIRNKLRDPQSAQFRNEKIRVIWSSNGDRKKVYCAEVNSNDEFGGKTGFSPALVVLNTKGWKNANGSYDLFAKGSEYVDKPDANDPNYYLDCVRADTQRKNGDIFQLTLGGYETFDAMKTEMDGVVPSISNRASEF